MTGKTHIAAGVAASLILIRPNDIKDIITTVVVSAFSSLIVDVDIKSSKFSKLLKKLVFLIVTIAISSALVDYVFNLGYLKEIINKINDRSIIMILLGIITVIFLSYIITKSGHRGFTHSLTALLLVVYACYIWLIPIISYPIIVGYGMHILADITNKKGVQLFYPFKTRYCLKLCKSNGLADKITFFSCTAIYMIMIILLIYGIVK